MLSYGGRQNKRAAKERIRVINDARSPSTSKPCSLIYS